MGMPDLSTGGCMRPGASRRVAVTCVPGYAHWALSPNPTLCRLPLRAGLGLGTLVQGAQRGEGCFQGPFPHSQQYPGLSSPTPAAALGDSFLPQAPPAGLRAQAESPHPCTRPHWPEVRGAVSISAHVIAQQVCFMCGYTGKGALSSSIIQPIRHHPTNASFRPKTEQPLTIKHPVTSRFQLPHVNSYTLLI